MGRGGCGTVGGTNARVVLRAAPAEANTRVANGIALHLIDGHLRGMTVDELDKATALARGDLDIGDLAKALEERAQLILSDIAREATDEDSGVVRVSELVHLRGRVETTVTKTSTTRGATAVLHTTTTPHLLGGHTTTHHGAAVVTTAVAKALVIVA